MHFIVSRNLLNLNCYLISVLSLVQINVTATFEPVTNAFGQYPDTSEVPFQGSKVISVPMSADNWFTFHAVVCTGDGVPTSAPTIK